MKKIILFFVMTLSWGLSAQVKPMAITDIGVMQQNGDGTYNVICLNGNREIVNDLDLKLGNVCPNLTESEPTEILSMQKRSDGNFDVVCRDFRNLVATADEIMAGQVCEPEEPEYTIDDGDYTVTSGYSNWCDQRINATHNDNQLTSLRVYFTSPCSASREMTCENNICSSQDYKIEVLSRTSYYFSNLSGSNRAVFELK